MTILYLSQSCKNEELCTKVQFDYLKRIHTIPIWSLCDKCSLKGFPDGLMDVMASKNISNCTVSYTALQMNIDLHFQPTLS